MALLRTETTALVGTTLELQPIYGWGWQPDFPWRLADRTVLPPRSTFALEGVVEFNAELNGGFGRVTGGETSLAGLWLCFEVREAGSFDLRTMCVHCNLVFRRDPPITQANHGDAWTRHDLLGYGFIGSPGFVMAT